MHQNEYLWGKGLMSIFAIEGLIRVNQRSRSDWLDDMSLDKLSLSVSGSFICSCLLEMLDFPAPLNSLPHMPHFDRRTEGCIAWKT